MNQEKQGNDSRISRKLSKHAYISRQPTNLPQKSLDFDLKPIQKQFPPVQQQSAPPQKGESQLPGTIDEDSNFNNEQIYKEHRQFLQRYKKQRQKQMSLKKLESLSSTEPKRSISMAEYEPSSSKQNKAFVLQKMSEIHRKISKQIVQQNYHNDRPYFKLFTDTVENKNDIQRVSKERRFIKSQQSHHYEYKEPSMPIKSRLPVNFRVKTEEIFDEAELSRNAKQFIERVQKQQQNLLGKHLLRKKIEQSKRSHQEIVEYKRVLSQFQSKRQQRKHKAEQNLLLIKQKLNLSKHHNRKNFQQLQNTSNSKRVKDFRYSIKDSRSHELQTKAMIEKSRIDILQKYKDLNKIATDRINNLKESEFKVKDKIAIRKHKLIRPTEYHETRTEETRFKTENSDLSYPEDQYFLKAILAKEGSSCDQFEEGDLPSNKKQNEFISFTQYQQPQDPERGTTQQ